MTMQTRRPTGTRQTARKLPRLARILFQPGRGGPCSYGHLPSPTLTHRLQTVAHRPGPSSSQPPSTSRLPILISAPLFNPLAAGPCSCFAYIGGLACKCSVLTRSSSRSPGRV